LLLVHGWGDTAAGRPHALNGLRNDNTKYSVPHFTLHAHYILLGIVVVVFVAAAVMGQATVRRCRPSPPEVLVDEPTKDE
jgi:hypothetical protein